MGHAILPRYGPEGPVVPKGAGHRWDRPEAEWLRNPRLTRSDAWRRRDRSRTSSSVRIAGRGAPSRTRRQRPTPWTMSRGVDRAASVMRLETSGDVARDANVRPTVRLARQDVNEPLLIATHTWQSCKWRYQLWATVRGRGLVRLRGFGGQPSRGMRAKARRISTRLHGNNL